MLELIFWWILESLFATFCIVIEEGWQGVGERFVKFWRAI